MRQKNNTSIKNVVHAKTNKSDLSVNTVSTVSTVSSINIEKKKKKPTIVFIFILFTLVLGIGGYGSYLFFSKVEKFSFIDYLIDHVSVYNSGLVCVELDGKYGYLDKQGKIVIDFKYDDATKFVNGFASVQISGEWFVINTKGAAVISDRYESTYVNKNKLITFQDNSKYGVLDKNGNIIVAAIYDYIYEYSNGLAVVVSNDRYGYINEKGAIVGEIKYDLAYRYINGFRIVSLYDTYFFLDSKGEMMGDIYLMIYPALSEAAIFVKKDSNNDIKFGLIDMKGNILCYDYDSIYLDDRIYNVFIAKKDSLYYILDKHGQEVNAVGYTSIRTGYSNLLLVEESDGVKHIVDIKNNIIIKKINEYNDYDISILSHIYLLKNDVTYLYDFNGKLHTSFKTDHKIQQVSNESIVVSNSDYKYGIIDFQGDLIIDFIYDEIGFFIDGYSIARLGDKFGIINEKGKIVVPITYEKIVTLNQLNLEDIFPEN